MECIEITPHLQSEEMCQAPQHAKTRASTVEEAVDCNSQSVGDAAVVRGQEQGLKKVVEILYIQVVESNSM